MNELIGFGLLCGHMVGDYILQNDWMAGNKTVFGLSKKDFDAKWDRTFVVVDDNIEYPKGTSIFHNTMVDDWIDRCVKTRTGHLSCTVHCFLYTLAIGIFSFWWMPWWGLLVCFLIHWPVDRFRLAAVWMNNVSGQKFFASKEHPMWPNSIILVDNTFHLVTLFMIAYLHFYLGN